MTPLEIPWRIHFSVTSLITYFERLSARDGNEPTKTIQSIDIIKWICCKAMNPIENKLNFYAAIMFRLSRLLFHTRNLGNEMTTR